PARCLFEPLLRRVPVSEAGLERSLAGQGRVLRRRRQHHPAAGWSVRLAGGRAGGLQRAEGPALLSRSGAKSLTPEPILPPHALDPEQSVEPVIFELGVGDFGQRRLGAI